MRQSLRKVSMTAGIVSAALLGMSQTAAIAVPSASVLAPPPTPAPAPDTGRAPAGSEASLENTGSATSTRALCVFNTAGDYVHVSSSAFEASGHGWWVNGNCNATLAVVTVQLQQYYSDGSWRNAGTAGRATVRSGGGAGNRATGRGGCNSNSLTGWRSVVDVDLVGLADDPGKLYTPSRNIYCRR
ncbi:hypothetical protein [Streptosporangium amethystogenes]|uniref:hypothetical protein n=1 Tax=Streptosporangium amethystogenes TaxID=2002 RepID=UPI00068D5499|nr:hypothetical protein [Streptosporangium amethystogenes]